MKRKILFLIESLGGGGAEKVLTTIVKNIDTQLFDVTVCAMVEEGVYEEEVANHVRFHLLLKNNKPYYGHERVWYWLKYHLIYDWLPLSWVYKIFIPQENDVEIAFVEGFATKLLSCSTNSKAKRIAWVHCDLKDQPWPIQRRIYKDKEDEAGVYRKYQKVVCVSKQVEQVMRDYYGLSNIMTIHNPIDSDAILHLAKQECLLNVNNAQYNIISVGRLERVKGFDELILIIRNIHEKGKNVHLWIVGEGTEEEALKLLVMDCGLESNVTFTGFLKNPYALMSKMNLFVCSSRAEGYSLVIAEALILGLPVVSMDCAGPREILSNTTLGVICDSYMDLEEQILKHIQENKTKVGDLAVFNMNAIMSRIESLLEMS